MLRKIECFWEYKNRERFLRYVFEADSYNDPRPLLDTTGEVFCVWMRSITTAIGINPLSVTMDQRRFHFIGHPPSYCVRTATKESCRDMFDWLAEEDIWFRKVTGMDGNGIRLMEIGLIIPVEHLVPFRLKWDFN